MHAVGAERIDDGYQIPDQLGDRHFSFKIELTRRLSEPAHIGSDDTVKAAQIRHPAIPEPRRAPIAMLEDQVRRIAPRISVVVDLIKQIRLVGSCQYRHWN